MTTQQQGALATRDLLLTCPDGVDVVVKQRSLKKREEVWIGGVMWRRGVEVMSGGVECVCGVGVWSGGEEWG